MSDPGITAALVAVIIALTKVIEIVWKRYGSNKAISSELDPELVRQIRVIHERVTSNNLILDREISDMKDHNEKMSAVLSDIVKCMEKVADSQTKTVEALEKIVKRQEVEAAVREELRRMGSGNHDA